MSLPPRIVPLRRSGDSDVGDLRSHPRAHDRRSFRSGGGIAAIAGLLNEGVWWYVLGVSLLDRITVDAQVCHGAPTVRRLRYPVEMIVGLLASGMTIDEVLADYDDLEADDVLAALEYAALVTRTRSSVPIPAV